jgi:uncharacterized lipoprotein YddW (UPF0748 family)
MNLKLLKILLPFAFCLFPLLSFGQTQTKAVWVRPFINSSAEIRGDAVKGRAAIRVELERIKRAGLNTVYVETFWDGYTVYPSEILPQRPLSIPYGTADASGKGLDTLQIFIEEGAKLGIKTHAWLHVFHQWNTNLGGLDKSPIFSKNPDWAQLDVKGSPLVISEAEGANRDIFKIFMSPSNPQVRKLLREIVGEIAEKYPDLGGIQWDYIRYPLQYPESPFDYNPLTLAKFTKETGLDATKLDIKKTPKEWRVWQDWKSKQVTEVVKELGELVRKKRPNWEISAAVFANIEENLRVKQQDWREWSKQGYIDTLCPMLYNRDIKRVEMWAKDFRADTSPKTKIYPAFFIGHFYDATEKKMNEAYLQVPAKFNFNGIAFFASQSLTDDLIERLSKQK